MKRSRERGGASSGCNGKGKQIFLRLKLYFLGMAGRKRKTLAPQRERKFESVVPVILNNDGDLSSRAWDLLASVKLLDSAIIRSRKSLSFRGKEPSMAAEMR